jgi:AAA domain
VRLVPYRLHELIADIKNDRAIFVVEGEKDTNTLRKHGLPATTNPMGAGNWRPEFNEFFRGADVVLIPDNDDPGRDHMQHVAKNLHNVAGRVRMLDLKQFWREIEGSDDISDWLDAGGSVDKLLEIVGCLAVWEPPAGNGHDEAPPEGEMVHDGVPGIVQVGEWCRSLGVSTEPLIADANGGEIVGKGQIGVIYGLQGTGKTAVEIAMGFAIEGGDGFGRAHLIPDPIYRANKGRVIFAIYEDPHDFRRRLIAQAQRRSVNLDDLNLAIISDTLNIAREKDRAELLKRIKDDAAQHGNPAFLSIDTVAAALGTESYNADDVGGALFDFARELRKSFGSTTMFVHHPGKDESKGMAGTYRFSGDSDFVLRAIAISGGFRLLKDKDRSGPRRALFDYALDFVEVERTASGHPRTGAILGTVTPCLQKSMPQHMAPTAKDDGDRTKLSRRYRLALERLSDAAVDAGTSPPAHLGLPASIRVVVKREAWREELIRTGVIDAERKNKRAAFQEIKLALLDKRLIGERDGFVWLVYQ